MKHSLPIIFASLLLAVADRSLGAEHIVTVTCGDLLGADKPLVVRMVEDDGRVTAALATSPTFNQAVHEIEVRRLVEGQQPEYRFDVRVQPDNFVPKDGKAFDAKVAVTTAGDTPTYSATVAGRQITGTCTIETAPVVEHPINRLALRMEGGVTRVYLARRSSWKYALDTDLRVSRRGGRWGPALLASIVPDYRRYSAVVINNNLTLKDHRLTGSITADLNYGGQGTGKDDPPSERYTYTFDGTAIGNTVGGSYTAQFGEQKIEGLRFVGSIEHDPPPAIARSVARLRLHRAMNDDSPVMLNLSLTDPANIHGYAWASGYNHQPHTVDASGLRLIGEKLHGQVKVTICPDIYKEPEIFTLSYQIDASVEDGIVLGKFTGDDRGRSVDGPITGRLTENPPPPPLEQVRQVQLNLGYALVSNGKAPRDWGDKHPNHAQVRMTLHDGKIVGTTVVHPAHGELYTAEVSEASINMIGDRLTGSVSFTLESDGLQPGPYRFTFRAIARGTAIEGYWRGTRDGNPIYTKSAKLGGNLKREPQR